MSILAALTILLLFSGSAFSQISYPDCTTTDFSWSYNSLNQNPCAVSAYLEATCNKGTWSLQPLPTGRYYGGPDIYWRTDLCMCNSVVYSLMSACDACQGAQWPTWPAWAFNCTQILPPSTFPNPVPDGTRVPSWALLDITLENTWNSNKSRTAGDSPEILPGELISASSSSSAFQATSTSPNPTTTPSPSGGSSSNTGAIVAGAVGGIAVVSIAVVMVFFLRRQRARASSDTVAVTTEKTAPFVVDDASQPMNQGRNAPSDVVTVGSSTTPDSPIAPIMVYNPNNAATFPEPQDPNAPHFSVQALLEQYPATGYTLANTHVSRPQGYGNLPNV